MINTKTQDHRETQAWCSQKLDLALRDSRYEEFLNSSQNLCQKKRVMDIFVSPGKITGRVQDAHSRFHKVSLEIKVFPEDNWTQILQHIVNNVYILGRLLNNDCPVEIDELISSCDTTLLPTSIDDITIHYQSKRIYILNEYVAAILYRFSTMLSNDPFLSLLWRGKRQNDLLKELKILRRKSKHAAPVTKSAQKAPDIEETPHPPTSVDTRSYWQAASSLNSLKYSIKADELPAAILKWLNPLPLEGFEDELEPMLEEAYAQVARRAQVYGLNL